MENARFENNYEVAKETLKHWGSLSEKRSGKHAVWLSFIFTLWIAVLTIVAWILVIFKYKEQAAPLAIITSFLLVFDCLKTFLEPSRLFKELKKQTGETRWFETIKFGENIECSSAFSTRIYSYDKVNFIEENSEAFYLWFNEQLVIRVYKGNFTVGNADDFRNFIYNKCCGIKPLWSKNEFNRKGFKKILPHIGVFFGMFAVIIVGSLALFPGLLIGSNNIDAVIKTAWNGFDDVFMETIAVAEYDDFAVGFGTDNVNGIYAVLINKSGNNYKYVSSHTYSIKDLDDYNKYYYNSGVGGGLFESAEEALSFASGKTTLVYGVADFYWYENNVSEKTKGDYEEVVFTCGKMKYVLYYREAGTSSKRAVNATAIRLNA